MYNAQQCKIRSVITPSTAVDRTSRILPRRKHLLEPTYMRPSTNYKQCPEKGKTFYLNTTLSTSKFQMMVENARYQIAKPSAEAASPDSTAPLFSPAVRQTEASLVAK